jgi:hypothetical protein
MLVAEQMFDVAACTAEKIIDTNHVSAVGEQAIAKVRTQKSRSTGN